MNGEWLKTTPSQISKAISFRIWIQSS